MNLEYEREHWMGYTLKEYREKYEELVIYASAMEFELKILTEGLAAEAKQHAGLELPTRRKETKKRKSRH